MPCTEAPRPLAPTHAHRLSLERIEAAREDIDATFLDSPLRHSVVLSLRLGCDLALKDETANPIGCFKGRGATCLMARAMARHETGPLVCASAGNFGLAMAYACARHARPLTVFVATGANPTKVHGIRRFGACVVVAGEDFDAAKTAARAHAQERSLRFVEDGAEVDVSEGAGTIACELLGEGRSFDALLVPLGNGALLAGMARWIKAHSPTTEVIGVCSAGAPVMAHCWRLGGVPSNLSGMHAETIADGIAVRVPVPSAVQDLQGLVDDVIQVDDVALLSAMRWLHADAGLSVEPSAAAGVAAIATQRERHLGKRVATVLTGRNLTPAQVVDWLG